MTFFYKKLDKRKEIVYNDIVKNNKEDDEMDKQRDLDISFLDDFEFEVIELDDVSVLPETAASSGSTGDNVYSTCGSCSCCSSCCT
ncbi:MULTISPECIES: thiazolylpeptide-type bacteriocin [unclassified Streptococcus]|uniref:thiazolylpeptide-type bacteriocin n=1 Tax=unclassified Streptococcus TaxID=2608887 RepID=UPI00359CEDC3